MVLSMMLVPVGAMLMAVMAEMLLVLVVVITPEGWHVVGSDGAGDAGDGRHGGKAGGDPGGGCVASGEASDEGGGDKAGGDEGGADAGDGGGCDRAERQRRWL